MARSGDGKVVFRRVRWRGEGATPLPTPCLGIGVVGCPVKVLIFQQGGKLRDLCDGE